MIASFPEEGTDTIFLKSENDCRFLAEDPGWYNQRDQ
jgi:hypothetical protein